MPPAGRLQFRNPMLSPATTCYGAIALING
jgi:hypothetical protein